MSNEDITGLKRTLEKLKGERRHLARANAQMRAKDAAPKLDTSTSDELAAAIARMKSEIVAEGHTAEVANAVVADLESDLASLREKELALFKTNQTLWRLLIRTKLRENFVREGVRPELMQAAITLFEDRAIVKGDDEVLIECTMGRAHVRNAVANWCRGEGRDFVDPKRAPKYGNATPVRRATAAQSPFAEIIWRLK